MTKYQTISNDPSDEPEIVDAKQWLKHGDDSRVLLCNYLKIEPNYRCPECGELADTSHGRICCGEDMHIVCPGDWLITDETGYVCLCSDKTFKDKFEPPTPRLIPVEWWHVTCPDCGAVRDVEVILEDGNPAKPTFCTQCGSDDIDCTPIKNIGETVLQTLMMRGLVTKTDIEKLEES